jgi:hypothetical protein
MTSESSRVWIIEKDSKKMGPYTREEIQRLLRNGEISPETRISSQHALPHYETTVANLLKSDTDPAHSLFDALQVAKDRSHSKATPAPISYQPYQRRAFFSSIPLAVKLSVGFTVFLVVGLFILSRWNTVPIPSNSTETSERTRNPGSQAPVSHPEPPQPIAPNPQHVESMPYTPPPFQNPPQTGDPTPPHEPVIDPPSVDPYPGNPVQDLDSGNSGDMEPPPMAEPPMDAAEPTIE